MYLFYSAICFKYTLLPKAQTEFMYVHDVMVQSSLEKAVHICVVYGFSVGTFVLEM